MRDTLKAFRALSDETKLRMLNLLLDRECCVCEVMQALDISQSKASRGLSALYDAGFLKLRKDGLWSIYSVDDDMKDYMADLVSAARKAFKQDRTSVLDRERLKKAKRTGPRCALNNGVIELPSRNAESSKWELGGKSQ